MTLNKIRAELLMKDYTFSLFAQEHGYGVTNVLNAVYRWAGRKGNPRGQTKSILLDLEKFIGKPIYISQEIKAA